MLCNMTERKISGTNRAKLDRAWQSLESMMVQVLREGFHGTAAVELVISDGTIQRLNTRLESTER